MNNLFPCECGHIQDKHGNVPTIIGCTAYSEDPKFYCHCCNFKPDNLKYLEQIYSNKVNKQ